MNKIKIFIFLIMIFYSNIAITQNVNEDSVDSNQQTEQVQQNTPEQKPSEEDQIKFLSTVKEEYADDPLSKTWNFLINSAIEVSRSWVALPEGSLPGFIPMSLVQKIAKQKKSYEK